MQKLQLALAVSISAMFFIGHAQAADEAKRYAPGEESRKYTPQDDEDYVPDYSARALAENLKRKGFYNIEIEDKGEDGYEVDACRKGREYEIRLTSKWRLLDKDDEGKCKYKYRGRDRNVHIDTPFATVDIDRGGRNKDVTISIPLIDLHIHKRKRSY